MMTLIIVIHVIACVVLIGMVLIQRGRGAGLVESFAGVESVFGTKTSAFLTRTTTIMSVVFFLTCLSLAVLSVRQSKSLLRDAKPAGGGLASDSQSHKPKVAARQAAVNTEPVKVEPVKAAAPIN
jgi:preprotein translocase subunit SecG